MTHPNSHEVYDAEKERLDTLRDEVFEDIRQNGPGTAAEIAARMGFRDRQRVAPRITEMVREEKLLEIGSRHCRVTGRTARVVGVLL